MTRRLAAAFLALAFTHTALADDLATRFEEEVIRPIVDEAPGGALVVVRGGQVVLEKTYGVRSVDDSKPITSETRFRLASVSKTFASAAAAVLVNEHPQVDWHSPLKPTLSHLRFKRQDYGDSLSLFHIMSQSTGLMPHAYTNLIEDNMPYERILRRLDKVDFVCRPGDCYVYQNVVFSLVGDLIKAQTRLDYATFVETKLFEPLNMQDASVGLEGFIADDNHARPHVWDGRRWVEVRTKPHYYRVAPAAGVNASIRDMAQWLLAQLGHQPEVLPPGMLDTLQTGAIKTTRQQAHYRYRRLLGDVYYGLGWRIFEYADQPGYVHHGGYVRGMRAEMVFNRNLQTGMVFLTNSEPGNLNEVVFEFVDRAGRDNPALAGSVGSVGR